MRFEIQYASTRQEVWRWYWRVWHRRLWKIHATILVLTAFLMAARLVRGGPGTGNDAFLIAGLGILTVVWFILHPQILFKRQVRTLTIDESGISTTIGSRSGKRRWAEISEVVEDQNAIVIQVRTGNAFIVPERAFESPAQRAAFLSFAQSACAGDKSA
jgi:hypothetical protein